MRYRRPRGEIQRIVDGTGWLPRQIARLQVPGLGMNWRESDIRDMLESGGMTGFARISYRHGAPRRLDGYILFRIMADEGEILSLAVRKQSRRRGIANNILSRTLIFMDNKHVKRAFLEVSAANRVAIAFYTRSGFKISGVRPGYYATNRGANHNALVLGFCFSPVGMRRIRGKQSRHRVGSCIFCIA
jgi:[ribosomal protein S18]-alanine N-acetyltransferase